MSESFAPELTLVIDGGGGELEFEMPTTHSGRLTRWNFTATTSAQDVEIFDRPGQALGDQDGLVTKIQPTAVADGAVLPDPIDFQNNTPLGTGGGEASETKLFLVTPNLVAQTLKLQVAGRS